MPFPSCSSNREANNGMTRLCPRPLTGFAGALGICCSATYRLDSITSGGVVSIFPDAFLRYCAFFIAVQFDVGCLRGQLTLSANTCILPLVGQPPGSLVVMKLNL